MHRRSLIRPWRFGSAEDNCWSETESHRPSHVFVEWRKTLKKVEAAKQPPHRWRQSENALTELSCVHCLRLCWHDKNTRDTEEKKERMNMRIKDIKRLMHDAMTKHVWNNAMRRTCNTRQRIVLENCEPSTNGSSTKRINFTRRLLKNSFPHVVCLACHA